MKKIFLSPTESEWEFAARGGVLSKGYKYAGGDDLNEIGWYCGNSGDKKLTGDWKLESGEKPLLLRTHTSPVQVRLMQEGKLPIRAVMPGVVGMDQLQARTSLPVLHLSLGEEEATKQQDMVLL